MVADNRSAPRAASSWQTGDVAGRASFRTARPRFAKPRTGTALAPLFRSHPDSVPSASERRGFYSLRKRCQALSPLPRQRIDSATLFAPSCASAAAARGANRCESKNHRANECRRAKASTGPREARPDDGLRAVPKQASTQTASQPRARFALLTLACPAPAI